MEICIKKSFIKDQNGVPRTSGITDLQGIFEKNLALRNIISYQVNQVMNYMHAVQNLSVNLEKDNHELSEVLSENRKVLSANKMIAKELDEKNIENACLHQKLDKMPTSDQIELISPVS